MDFNLLKKEWIPVRCRDGSRRIISPAQIGDPEIIAPDWPRPDFNVATLEFLIGLLQTACPPETEREWAADFKTPKSESDLRALYVPFLRAFEFGGGEHRFMQEHGEPLKFNKSVNRLLFETPGDKTINLNKDFFVKRVDEFVLSPEIAAIALITRQLYDNGFGGGFRSTLRGAGAMVTLIMGDNLWESLWLNVMCDSHLNRDEVPISPDDPKLFPWLAPTRTSEEKEAPPILAEEMHPLHVFWCMPNRLQLSFEEGEFECAISGEPLTLGCRELLTGQHGMNYGGKFIHPLSPFFQKDDKFSFRTGSELSGRGGTYRSYGDLAFDGVGENKPALVVTTYQQQKRAKSTGRIKTRRMLCAGWNLSKAKALGFVNLTMPVYPLEGEDLVSFQRSVDELTTSAEEAAKILMTAVCRALYAEPSAKSKGGLKWDYGERKHIYGSTLGEQVEEQFWHSTEPFFFLTLDAISGNSGSDLSDAKAVKTTWLGHIGSAALRVFDSVLDASDFQQSKPKSMILARQEMQWFLNSKDMYGHLNLTKPESKGAA